ncbi:hypothetical protein D3C86_1958270 [compost metagenome]
MNHRPHQRLRPRQAVSHALRRKAAVAQPVAPHVFDHAAANEQQHGDGGQRDQFGEQGVFEQEILHK